MTVKLVWTYPIEEEINIDGFEVSQCEFDKDTGVCTDWGVVNQTLIAKNERSFDIAGIPDDDRSFAFIVQAVKIQDGNRVRSDPSNLVQRFPADSGGSNVVEVVIKVKPPATLSIEE